MMVANPLKDTQRIRAAMNVVAKSLVDEINSGTRESFRACDFAREVYRAMGFRNFAYNDTGCRMRLHEPKSKEAAFLLAGVSSTRVDIRKKKTDKEKKRLKWLIEHELSAKPTVVVVPQLPTGQLTTPSAPPSASALAAQLADVSRADLEERGAILIPGLLTPQQAHECLIALGQNGALEKHEEKMRESVGHGVNGAYTTIKRTPAALKAVCDALRTWLTPPPAAGKTKTLLLKYGEGGINWAHQDQGTSPWQAVMLLNPPSEFTGGALYVVDVAQQPLAPLEVPFTSAGDVVVFAANSNEPRGRHLYHGMSEVTQGRRFAVGMFQ